MNYLYMNPNSLENGDGVRVSIFFSGCPHKCNGCFSENTWDRYAGEEFTEKVKYSLMENLASPYISGISILGGDPLAPYNREEVVSLCKEIKSYFPDKTIYIWTGYTFSFLKKNVPEILNLADIIVTERFNIKMSKEFYPKGDFHMRGSLNQNFVISGEEYHNLPKK